MAHVHALQVIVLFVVVVCVLFLAMVAAGAAAVGGYGKEGGELLQVYHLCTVCKLHCPLMVYII